MSALRPDAKGDLGSKPLSQLLLFLFDKGLSGALIFEDPEGRRSTVTLRDGQPQKTRIPSEEHRLGTLLLDFKLIESGELDAALQQASPPLLGQKLVARGSLGTEQLESVLREQLLSHLGWIAALPASTQYGFFRGQDFLAARPHLEEGVDPLGALWRVAEAHPPLGLEEFMGRLAGAPLRLHADSRVRRFRLQPDERAALDVLRAKPQSLAELAATDLLPRARLERLLYLLALTRHLNVGDSGAPLGVEAPAAAQAGARVPPRPRKLPASRVPQSVRAVPASTESSDETQWEANIAELVAASDSADYYTLLGVDPEADTAAIQRAFFQLARRWHPDKLPANLNPTLRTQVVKVFARMTEGHQVLTHAGQRLEYDRLTAEGQNSEEEQERVQEILRAATLFQKAEVLARRQDWATAESMAREALDLDGEQPEYRALHAWIIAKGGLRSGRDSYSDLLVTLAEASNAHANNVRIRHYRAQVLQIAGRTAEAMREYKRVVETDPRHVEAQRELRLFQMRRGESKTPPPDRPGLLQKLFKKH